VILGNRGTEDTKQETATLLRKENPDRTGRSILGDRGTEDTKQETATLLRKENPHHGQQDTNTDRRAPGNTNKNKTRNTTCSSNPKQSTEKTVDCANQD
jgi:hypothetical protein